MTREFPAVRFERYADDAIAHCTSKEQAERLLEAIANRLEEAELQLNPAKTRIVYCKDGRRKLDHEHIASTFLGFTFRARGARSRNGVSFTGFLPAVSNDALNKMSREVRRWRLHPLTGNTLADLARKMNPIARGWMRYYGAFNRTMLDPLLARINAYLMRWIGRIDRLDTSFVLRHSRRVREYALWPHT